MVDINQFKFSIASRHPKFLNAYDAASHSYKPEYISPAEWHLKLSFDIEDALRLKRRELEELQHSPIPSVNTGADTLVNTIASLEKTIQNHNFWFRVEKIGMTINHPDGTQSVRVTSTQDSAVNVLHPTVRLTQQGKYRITSFVERKNNPAIQPKQLSKPMTLKDILICTIGDSYACGEGLPDVAATPNRAMKLYADRGAFRTLISIRDDSKEHTPELELAMWQEPLAHRSYNGGSTIAAQLVSGAYADLQLVSTHATFARSGAKIHEGLIGPRWHSPRDYRNNRHLIDVEVNGTAFYAEQFISSDSFGYLDDQRGDGQITEMEQALGNRHPDFLIVTIGGNDCGWREGFVGIIRVTHNVPAVDVQDLVNQYLEQELEKNLIALNERLKVMPNPPRFVLLTLYPNGFFGSGTAENPTTSRNCGIFDAIDLNPLGGSDSFIGIDDGEAEIIKTLAIALNQKLRSFASNQNQRNRQIEPDTNQPHSTIDWHIVDGIDRDFETHGYCSETPWFISAEKSFLTQGDWNGLLHPNSKGQEAYAKRIAEKIRAILNNHLEEFRPKEFQRVGDPRGGGSNPSTTTRSGVT